MGLGRRCQDPVLHWSVCTPGPFLLPKPGSVWLPARQPLPVPGKGEDALENQREFKCGQSMAVCRGVNLSCGLRQGGLHRRICKGLLVCASAYSRWVGGQVRVCGNLTVIRQAAGQVFFLSPWHVWKTALWVFSLPPSVGVLRGVEVRWWGVVRLRIQLDPPPTSLLH